MNKIKKQQQIIEYQRTKINLMTIALTVCFLIIFLLLIVSLLINMDATRNRIVAGSLCYLLNKESAVINKLVGNETMTQLNCGNIIA